jgi:hypothetical protein
MLHQYRLPLLNPVGNHIEERMVVTVATVNGYLGRLHRPDVSNQGTLQVVANFGSLAYMVGALA